MSVLDGIYVRVRFDEFLTGVEIVSNAAKKLVLKQFQIDIQNVDVRYNFIGILSNEAAVGPATNCNTVSKGSLEESRINSKQRIDSF